jgi:hypothetical protein
MYQITSAVVLRAAHVELLFDSKPAQLHLGKWPMWGLIRPTESSFNGTLLVREAGDQFHYFQIYLYIIIIVSRRS